MCVDNELCVHVGEVDEARVGVFVWYVGVSCCCTLVLLKLKQPAS